MVCFSMVARCKSMFCRRNGCALFVLFSGGGEYGKVQILEK